MRALLIAEKPSVAKTVQAAFQSIKGSYPYTVDFTSAAGHLVELSMPDQYTEEWGLPWNVDVLPIIPDNWKKEVISASSKFYNNIKQLIKDNDYDILINCCDCGREGEHIFYNIYEKLGLSIPVKRMWYDDQTEDELRRSINNLRDSDEFKGYRYASDLREKFDWLIGINFTRMATLKTNQKIVIGRCITVILSMVVKRELAIKNFVPTPFFELEATFVTSDGEFYTGKLVNTAGEGKTNRFDDKAMLESIDFSKPTYKVTKVKKGRIVTKPKSLLNIAALQKECNTQYGYTADKTLKIAQSLYEKKILSYPRTDCRYITTGMVDDFTDLLSSIAVIPELQPHVSGVIGNTSIYDRIKASKDFVNNKKITDHPALTPTKEKPDWGSLSKDEQNVYLTVAKRFLAMFLDPCVYNKVDVTTESSAGDVFITNGKTLDSLGWKVLYNNASKDIIIPALEEEQAVSIKDSEILEKQTQPPKHYTEASLLEAMETAGKELDDKELQKVLDNCEGIGTGATRAELIEKTIRYEWLERKKEGKTIWIIPLEKGYQIAKTLAGQEILSPSVTAYWEKRLHELETTNSIDESVYDDIKDFISKTCTDMWNTLPELTPTDNSIGKCPICGEPVISGKKTYFCSGYFNKDESGNPNCIFGFAKKLCGADISTKEAGQLLIGKVIGPKKFTYNGKEFTNTLEIGTDSKNRTNVVFSPPKPIGTCPVCSEGKIWEGSKSFYCDQYREKDANGNPKCHFTIWKSISGGTITRKDACELLNDGITKAKVKLKNKDGESYTSKLQLIQTDTGDYKVIRYKTPDKEIGTCPLCKGKVLEKDKVYKCNNPQCNAMIYKTLYKAKLTGSEALVLLGGKPITKTCTFSNGTRSVTFTYDRTDNQVKAPWQLENGGN